MTTITLTDIASQKAKEFLKTRGKGIGIRFGVKTTGCSGLAYTVEYADHINPSDLISVDDGLRILVDAKSAPFLVGMQVDYVKTGLNEGFEFSNPNEKDACGCGLSFRV